MPCPTRDRQCAITLEVSLRSAGDPWDKSGTLFAFADGAGRDYLKRMQDGGEADTSRFAGITPDGIRKPALELLRFITPFGVGHFSQNERALAYKPESVGAWADSVWWSAGLSRMQAWLTGADTLWVGVAIDTWTAEGYTLAQASMDERPAAPPSSNDPSAAQHHQTGPRPALHRLPRWPADSYSPLKPPPKAARWTSSPPVTATREATNSPNRNTSSFWTATPSKPGLRGAPTGHLRRFAQPAASGLPPILSVVTRWRARGFLRPEPLNWCPGRRRQASAWPRRPRRRRAHLGTIPGAQAWTDSTFNFWNIAATLHHP